MRRLMAVLVITSALGAIGAPAASAVDRGFTPRFSANDAGDITLVGNTLLTCQDAAAGCVDARAGRGAQLNNNDYAMRQVDVDSDATTFNSSTANLALPAGATVLFAGLYYGGDVTGTPAAPNAGARDTVRFRAPGETTYASLTAAVDDSSSSAGRYQGFVDVTDRVRAAGNGTYSVANVQTALGADQLAGWSLVIAYRDATQVPRNLTIFDGLKSISAAAAPTDIVVNGFTTPPAGTVRSSIGLVSYEGDLGTAGDTATLLTGNGSFPLTNAQNAKNNFFNSSISLFGNPFTAKNPDYPNQLGYDADILNGDGYLKNGDTSATIRVTTSGDVYLPGVVTFSTQLYAPNVVPAKSVQNISRASGPAQPGDTLRYTVTYPNNGQDAAVGFTSTDPIPDDTTYVADSLRVASGPNAGPKTDPAGDDQAEYEAAANRVRVRLGTGASATRGGSLGPSASTSYTFDVRVDADAADGTDVDNVASADFTGAQLGIAFSDQRTPPVTTRVRRPDLRLNKTHRGTITAGDTTTFSIVASNAGGIATSGAVTVTDTLPAASFDAVHDVGGPGWDCSATQGLTVSCTRSDALAPGGSYPAISLDADVAANPPASIVNTASVSGGGDNSPGDNTSTDTSANTPRADLSLRKDADPGTVAVGQTVDYTLLARNTGPSPATAATITDTLPAGLTYVSASPGCSANGQVVTCVLGTLAKNATRSVRITARATAAANDSTVTNNAQLSSPVTDPDPTNNQAAAPLTVANTADVSITKTPSVQTPNAGDPFSYALTVSNAGPGGASGTTVTDVLPASFTLGSVVAPGWTCNTPGLDRRLICTLTGSLASGANSAITLNGTFTTAAEGTFVTNSAGVTTTATDPDSSNNADSSTITATPAADLSVSKSFSAPRVNAGGTVNVTLRAENAGPSAAVTPTVTDVLPAGLQLVPATLPADCTATGQTVRCTLATLASGAVDTRTFAVTVNQAGGGVITNRVSVSSTTGDPVPSNNTGERTLTVNNAADVALRKTATQTASVGGQVTYTLEAINSGPDAATNVRVADTLPAGMTFVSATPSTGACTENAGAVNCSLGTLAAPTPPNNVPTRATVTIVAQAGASTAGTTVRNTASVATDTFDTDPTNDTGSATSEITPRADLSLTKSVVSPSPGAARVNQDITYQLDVANAGPNAAEATTVTDTLPSGTRFVIASPGCTLTLNVVSCDLGTVAANTVVSRTITVQSTVGNADTIVDNDATVSSTTADPDAQNNTSRASSRVAPQVDLRLSETVSNPSPSVGDTFTYDFTIRNTGPSTATGVTFTDVLPTGVELTSVPTGCTVSGSTITCNLGTLASGGQTTLSLPVRLTAQGAGASLTDAASVTAAEDEANPANNQSQSLIAAAPAVDLSLSKTAAGGSPQAGGRQTYTLVVRNGGPATATGVALSDPLPAGLRAVSATASQGSCDVAAGRCALGSLAPGASAQVVLVADVTGPAGTAITNTASVSADQDELTPGDGTARATVTPVAPGAGGGRERPDVHIDKVVDDTRASVGQTLRYRITLVNRGTAAATGVAVTDTFAGRASVLSVKPSQGRCSTKPSVRCSIGTLAAGARATVTVTARALEAGTLRNTASVVGTGQATADPRQAVDGASSRVSRPSTRVVVQKRAARRSAAAGDTLSYVITARNTGRHEARGVRVCDTLPTGLSFVSARGARFRGGKACWTFARMGAGRTRRVAITVRVQRLARRATVRNGVAVKASNSRRSTAGANVTVRPGASRGGGVTG